MKTRRSRYLLVAVSLLLLTQYSFAEVRNWTDKEGNSREAELVNAFGPMAYFKDTEGSFSPFLASELCDEDQALVEVFKEAKTVQPWEDSKSEMAQTFKGRLFAMEEGKSENFSFGPEPEPDFYVLYFVDPTDEKGNELTPRLVKVYNRLRESGLNNFEIIMVTQVRSSGEQKKYMVEMETPWPAIKWTSRKWLRQLTAIKGRGSLHLVILDQEGHIIQRTMEGSEDLQPANAMLALNNLLAWTNMENPVVIKYRYQQLLKNMLVDNPSDAAPKPYSCGLSEIDFSRIPDGSFKVKMRVTASGGVEDVNITTEMPEEIKDRALEAISSWLFIPQVKDGAYIDTVVAFPVRPK